MPGKENHLPAESEPIETLTEKAIYLNVPTGVLDITSLNPSAADEQIRITGCNSFDVHIKRWYDGTVAEVRLQTIETPTDQLETQK